MKKVLTTWNSYGNIHIDFEVDGKRDHVMSKYPWWFAIEKKDAERTKELLSSTKFQYTFKDNDSYPNYTKIYCEDDFGETFQSRTEIVLHLEENRIQTYEGDVLNDKRWYVDKDIKISDKFNKLYYDIETDDSIGSILVGRDRILSFAAIDNTGKRYYHVLESRTDDAERTLLVKFLSIIGNYDIILGWNSSEFDMPYLKSRMRKFGINRSDEYKAIHRIAKYDLLKRMRHAYRFDSNLRSFSLDYISKHFLNKGKVKFSGKVIDLYLNDRPTLKKYNLEDCVLVKEIDEKLGISDMMIKQASWCGVPPIHFGLYSILDTYILKTAHTVGKFGKTSLPAIKERDGDNGRINENPDDSETEKNKYIGALVLEPKIGKYDKIYTFDFKSLYPSIMQTSNIGYDSISLEETENCIVNPGTTSIPRLDGKIRPTFFSKEPSVINLAITQLLTLRAEYKNRKLQLIENGKNKGPEYDKVVSDEIVVKELSNSTYGIMGLSYGRYYSTDVAESITLFGQWCILFAKKHFENREYEVIYGDTDSVFVNTFGKEMDVDTELEIFHEELKKELTKYNIEDVHIQLNFDKEYDGFILCEKKTYVGNVVNTEGKKGKYRYARGLDYIKKNTFQYASIKQQELIEYILQNNPTLHDIQKWMKTTYDEYLGHEFSIDELTLVQKIGKDLHQYTQKTVPVHVRIAKETASITGKISRNTEIEYVIIRSLPGEPISGISVDKFTGEYDKDYYWLNKTLPILTRITIPVFGEIDYFEKQLTLF